MPVYKKVNKKFFKKWSYDMAYVLGFIFADGNVLLTKRNTWFWSIQITDKSLLTSIKNIINSDHKISTRISNIGNKKLYRLQVGSKEMCENLIALGVMPKKSRVMVFPNISREYFNDFLRGYFDGDGHVWVGNRRKKVRNNKFVIILGFTSGSKDFLIALKDKIRKYIGIKGGSLVCKKRGYELKYSILDSLKIYGTMYNTGYGTLYLPRKKRIFEKFIALRT